MNRPEIPGSPLWTSRSSEVNRTGTWRAAEPVWQDLPSPCHAACPVAGRIAVWIGQLEAGDLRGAWETLVANNPFPAVAGRVCHHPCEGACNRAQLDGTVGICSLERFVGDAAIAEGWAFAPPAREEAVSVAVVGAGPAGLSAAYQLRRAGVRVILHEAADAPGGLMRHGIPAYRLSRRILDAEIDRILAMGVELRTGDGIAGRAGLEALADAHDAVFLATGASRPRRLPGLDYGAGFVVEAAAFLAAGRAGQAAMTGGRVVVVGGGSAAMDVARTARRLGRAVTVMSLEPRERMPAQPEELEEAAGEGVEFRSGFMLRAAEPAGEGVRISAVGVDFAAGEAPGRFTVTERPGTALTLEADTIIPAIGQDADVDRWAGLLEAEGGVVRIAPGRGETSHPRIFAGGDVAGHDRFVTRAIGMGREAAAAILARILPDRVPEAPYAPAAPVVGFERINTAYHPPAPRNRRPLRPLPERLEDFDEVQLPLAPAAARAEAARCFSCGSCIGCDNCYLYCPDMAVNRLFPGYSLRSDYCKGCGLCVAECPTGAVHMEEGTTS